MQHICLRCKKEFKHTYLLRRHYKRIITCKEPISEAISLNKILENKVKELDLKLNETIEKVEKLTEDLNKSNIKCSYCLMSFTTQAHLTRHNLGRCKEKNDNICIYERELCIEQPKHIKFTCRFCSLTLSTSQSYSRHMIVVCKEQKKYEAELKEKVLNNRIKASAQIINTNNIQNIININLPSMNPFGYENLDYITTKLLIKELDNCKQIQQADINSIIDRFTKLIHANPAHPENHNVLFKNLNSAFARVYTKNGFQDQQSTEVQDEIIQQVHKLIQKTGCDGYNYEGNSEFADILDDIDINYGKLEEEIKDGINTRALSKCRNTIKAALHSNKNEIMITQNIIEN